MACSRSAVAGSSKPRCDTSRLTVCQGCGERSHVFAVMMIRHVKLDNGTSKKLVAAEALQQIQPLAKLFCLSGKAVILIVVRICSSHKATGKR